MDLQQYSGIIILFDSLILTFHLNDSILCILLSVNPNFAHWSGKNPQPATLKWEYNHWGTDDTQMLYPLRWDTRWCLLAQVWHSFRCHPHWQLGKWSSARLYGARWRPYSENWWDGASTIHTTKCQAMITPTSKSNHLLFMPLPSGRHPKSTAWRITID